MVAEGLRDFFAASASVAGALIGLLFVAITVAAGRLNETANGGPLHRIRASGALTSLTNALALSLFALIPDESLAPAAIALACVGLLFVTASLLSLFRLRQFRWRIVRDGLFLGGLIVVFATELVQGIQLAIKPADSGAVDTLAVLVAICCLIGIDRAWELVGGPSIGIRQEVTALVRGHERSPDGDGEEPAT